jgi:hypothetical protein
MAAAVLVTKREAAGVAAPVLTVAAAAQLWLVLLALAVCAFLVTFRANSSWLLHFIRDLAEF